MKKTILILASTTLLFGSVAYSDSATAIDYVCAIYTNVHAQDNMYIQHKCYSTKKSGKANATVDGTYPIGKDGLEFVIKPPASTCCGQISAALVTTGAYVITMAASPEEAYLDYDPNVSGAQCTKISDGHYETNATYGCALTWNYNSVNDFTELKFTVKPQ
jgi:hypothetical protein